MNQTKSYNDLCEGHKTCDNPYIIVCKAYALSIIYKQLRKAYNKLYDTYMNMYLTYATYCLMDQVSAAYKSVYCEHTAHKH